MTQENALRQSEPGPTAELIATRIEQSPRSTLMRKNFFEKMGLDPQDPLTVQAITLLYRKKALSIEMTFSLLAAMRENYTPSLVNPHAPDIVMNDGTRQTPFGLFEDGYARSYIQKLKEGGVSLLKCSTPHRTYPCDELESNVSLEFTDYGLLVLVEPHLGAAYACKAVVGEWDVAIQLNTGEVFAPSQPFRDLIKGLRRQHAVRPGTLCVLDTTSISGLNHSRPDDQNPYKLHFTRLLNPSPSLYARGMHSRRYLILKEIFPEEPC